MRIVRNDDEPPGPPGRYEVRDHPSLHGLVVIWWLPEDGPPSATNMTLGAERVPLLAEALDAYLRGLLPACLAAAL